MTFRFGAITASGKRFACLRESEVEFGQLRANALAELEQMTDEPVSINEIHSMEGGKITALDKKLFAKPLYSVLDFS